MSDTGKANLQWNGKNSLAIPETDIGFRVDELVFPALADDKNSLFYSVTPLDKPDNTQQGRIFKSDNLPVLNYLINNGYQESIDLIYIDPPYLSAGSYNSTVKIIGDVNYQSEKIQRSVFVDNTSNNMESYLSDIYLRLLLMKKLLSKNGSIFVHLDWHISHYVKVIMDEIFGMDNFINEIVWCYGGGSGTKRHFHRKHDLILWYSVSDEYIFNPQYRPYTPGTLQRGLTRVKGDKYRLHEQGALLQDWWTDINKILSPTASENLKFPTQKPEALIKRLILAATNKNALVADFYSGSGTLASVCQELGRKWIICDDSSIAIQTAHSRLIKQGLAPFSIEQPENVSRVFQDQRLQLKKPVFQFFNDQEVIVLLGIDNYQAAKQNTSLLQKAWDYCNLIDFWEIDPDFDGNCFNSKIQIVREGKAFDANIAREVGIKVPARDNYIMAVKVHDIFGDNAINIIEFTP
jgi:site-specific DNA-methyltransferase (adenine-specific)